MEQMVKVTYDYSLVLRKHNNKDIILSIQACMDSPSFHFPVNLCINIRSKISLRKKKYSGEKKKKQ